MNSSVPEIFYMAVAAPLQSKSQKNTMIAEKACSSTVQRKANGEMINKTEESLPKNENPLQTIYLNHP
jgi:hypothetical protein